MKKLASIPYNPRLLAVLLLAFASALPLPLIGSNLSLWMADAGFSLSTVAGFALLHLPYSFTILWNPMLDLCPSPLKRLGHRKGWAVTSLMLSMLSLMMMGTIGLASSFFVFWLLLSSIFAGWIYLTSINYEIESLSEEEYGKGSSVSVIGYRAGLVVSGAGTLYLANFFGWDIAYIGIASLLAVTIAVVLMQPEPHKSSAALETKKARIQGGSWFSGISEGLYFPIKELLQSSHAPLFFAILFTYKLGQDLLDRMLGPFYLEMGFNKVEIASATKILGMASLVIGAMVASRLLSRFSLSKGMLLFGAAHALSHFFYMLLANSGNQLPLLYVTIIAEQTTKGMMMSGLITYLWRNCTPGHGGAQYTFMWTVISIKHDLIASLSGWCVNLLGWNLFFAFTILLSIPSLMILYLYEQLGHAPSTGNTETT